MSFWYCFFIHSCIRGIDQYPPLSISLARALNRPSDKKYVLLAYFQDIKSNFNSNKLYPYLQDLVFHYQNLLVLKENKELIKDSFPERLIGPDAIKLEMVYEKIVKDDDIMNEIEDIISFSIPEFKRHLSEGKDLYEYFETNMEISPVGLMPLYPEEGYLFIAETDKKDTKIFEYQISILQSANEKYRGVYMNLLETRRRSIGVSFESLKIDLIKKYKKLPNPATYLIETKVVCPLDESLLPIAKRLLVKYVSTTMK